MKKTEEKEGIEPFAELEGRDVASRGSLERGSRGVAVGKVEYGLHAAIG